MPGIFGYIKSLPNDVSQIKNMTDAMFLYSHLKIDEQFEDDKIAASRVHLGHIGENSSPYRHGDLFIWIEGEAYNLKDLTKELQIKNNGFAESIAESYCKGILDKFLNKLDGYFCAVLYDSKNKNIKLISDRYGMRMLYWYFKDGLFAWSSEVKGLLAIKGIDKTIDNNSIRCFFDIGYLLGENTFLENIKLIKPATVVDFNLKSLTVNEYHYWKWSEIKPSNLSFDEAVEQLGYYFIEAVKRRFNPSENIGIALSGGLDSRAIFAAVNYLYPDYSGYAYTFGQPECDDIKIAKKVVALTEWEHEVFYFNNNNWFEPRITKIWNTDGMQDILHMHGSEFLERISEKIKIKLNGYGGSVIGGGFINNDNINEKISRKIAIKHFKKYTTLLDIENDFYNINHIEPLIYMNRVRRRTNMGTVNGLMYVDQRTPIYDNSIIELIFSLPDEYRQNNKLYTAFLLRFFPKFFNKIPWKRTGQPVGITKKPIRRRVTNKLLRIIENNTKLNLKNNNKNLTNYPEWIRNPKISKKIKEILSSTEPELNKIFEKNPIEIYLNPHLKKEADYHNEILRLITIQEYFNQVKEIR